MADLSQAELILALPSKGALSKSTMELLGLAGLKVSRPNERQYVGYISPVPDISVVFQRAADIYTKVKEGHADIGITGYDIVREESRNDDDVLIIYEKLGFGRCELVLAVPDAWIDIDSIDDLADLAIDFKRRNRPLRIVTKYHNLTREWLNKKKIINFATVDAKGALEAAPTMGYGDMICDITSTGTTLRENHLKRIRGGTLLSSQACIIANKHALTQAPSKQLHTKRILESIEAHLEAKQFASVTANMRGSSVEDVGRQVSNGQSGLQGLRGPTVAHVYTGDDETWFAVTMVVHQTKVSELVTHLRALGGMDITVFLPNFIFESGSSKVCEAFERMLT